jgi:hypothetical protein
MARRDGITVARLAASLLLAAALAGACSAQPVSEVTQSGGPAASAPTSPDPATGSAAPPSDAPGSAQASPEATPTTTPATNPGVPGKPGDVTWKRIKDEALGGGRHRLTFRITWTAPKGVAQRFTVVGVTECLRDAKAFNDKPCLVKGMRIPKGVQEVVAQVPGTERSVDISWKVGELDPGPYRSILIRASNDAGDSIFAIAWSDTVCWHCTY